MIKQLPLVLTLSLATGAAMADTQRADYQDRNASAEETAGFFSGVVVGGLAGGPPGAIVGAAIGALTGDGFRARREVTAARADLIAAELETARLREESTAMSRRLELAQQELESLRTSGASTLPAYLPASRQGPQFDNTALTVHFRTGSALIEPQYEQQLQSLVRLARQLPSAAVEITGYADRSGDAENNLRLSRQRSQAIGSFLKKMGVEDSSITTVAYGETRPLHDTRSLETDFFDRRVIVRLIDTSQQMLSSNPDGE